MGTPLPDPPSRARQPGFGTIISTERSKNSYFNVNTAQYIPPKS